MSVLIRGRKLPKDCPRCPMAHYNAISQFTGCEIVSGKRFAVSDDKEYASSSCRPEWCPLIEIPPHGRLIDADELRRSHCLECSFYPDNCLGDDCDADSVYHIDHAKTIIEAEV